MESNYIAITTEKPSVARDYAKYLKLTDSEKHDGYIAGFSSVLEHNVVITWAVGHLITMSYPEKYDASLKNWSLDTLPFLPDKYKYEEISSVKKQFNVVKKVLTQQIYPLSAIYYAGDSAREGLYIQFLIRMMSSVNADIEEKVVWLSSLTEKEVLRGIREAKPLTSYRNKVNAGFARAIEDYACGINFSRAFSCKYGYELNKALNSSEYKPIAVGRVMSCVLGMVVRREREIRDFKEIPFYKIAAIFDAEAEWKATDKSFYFNSPLLYNENGFKEKDKADMFASTCSMNPVLSVTSCSIKEEKKVAPLLFNLAELQLFCSKKYKISPDETLKVAQTLYEAKFITYPRTDSRYLSTAIANEIKYNLNGLSHGDYKLDYIKEIASTEKHKVLSSTIYVNDEKVSDHYAIIPTGKSNEISNLSPLELNILHDIIDRFLCIFFPPCIFEKGEMVLSNKTGEEFFCNAKTVKAEGWTKLLDDCKVASENPLKHYKIGDEVFANYEVREGKTSPPKRYSSGSMVVAMENAGKLIEDEELRSQIKGSGIGTSATRAAIISKLVTLDYLKLNKKTQILTPSELGEAIYDILEKQTPSLLNPEMTASWEKGLSQIESGSLTYPDFIKKLNKYISDEVNKIKDETVSINITGNADSEPILCPICKTRNLKENSIAFSCEGYKDKSNPCNFTIWKIIAEKELSLSDVRKICVDGKSNLIKGFVSRDGKKIYNAYLKLEGKELKLEFAKSKGKSKSKDKDKVSIEDGESAESLIAKLLS